MNTDKSRVRLGTQLTGTIGPRRCSFVWPLLGVTLGMPFLIGRTEFSPSFNIPALFASCVFEWKVEWNPEYFSLIPSDKLDQTTMSKIPKRKTNHSMKHYVGFVLAAMIFSCIFTSAVYQNLQVDIKGRRVRVKDVLKDFLQSQEFILICQQLAKIARELWQFYLKYGLKGIWTQIWMSIESESERKAYEVNSSYMIKKKKINQFNDFCRHFIFDKMHHKIKLNLNVELYHANGILTDIGYIFVYFLLSI